jgi:RNA polymerase sigma-70 factor, ECF subfamily
LLANDPFRFPAALDPAVEHCWRKAAADASWGLTLAQFRQQLERSTAQRFSGKPPETKIIKSYLDTLHVADLALAGACAAGNSPAWEAFVERYRPELYRAARAIAGEACGRELADSLYADLFGLREPEGRRKSLFEYFQGRSSLGTWLRAVLAQRHVDEIRRSARTEPLENTAEGGLSETIGSKVPVATAAAHDPERIRFLAMLQAIVATVLAALDARDRLRLAYYYVDDLTLAEIGRILGEHEATVSRKLERTRTDVRRRVEMSLRQEKKLSDAQVLLCFEYALEQWPFDLTRVLSARE